MSNFAQPMRTIAMGIFFVAMKAFVRLQKPSASGSRSSEYLAGLDPPAHDVMQVPEASSRGCLGMIPLISFKMGSVKFNQKLRPLLLFFTDRGVFQEFDIFGMYPGHRISILPAAEGHFSWIITIGPVTWLSM
jgi:hypothetical protein